MTFVIRAKSGKLCKYKKQLKLVDSYVLFFHVYNTDKEIGGIIDIYTIYSLPKIYPRIVIDFGTHGPYCKDDTAPDVKLLFNKVQGTLWICDDNTE